MGESYGIIVWNNIISESYGVIIGRISDDLMGLMGFNGMIGVCPVTLW